MSEVTPDILALAQAAANEVDHEDHDEAVRVALEAAAPLLMAQALEDVDNYVDEVMFHSDEETSTGPLVAGRGPLISLLRERAAALRNRA